MPTRQIQKTRLAATTTKTTITQKQSIEVVQTLLHGGLSSLAYLRSFFADKAFSEQYYEMSSGIPSYRDYADGKLPKRSGTKQTAMQILRRGRSQRADMFLDWLEKVAFVALRNGTLKALHIYVHTDPENREKVVETYTFTVKYHLSRENGQKIAGLEVESPTGVTPVTVQDTNVALQDILRDFMRICQHLPELPNKRYVSMNLDCMTSSEEGPQPKGFELSTSSQLRFATADGWGRTTTAMQELRSAFHSTTLKVTHLHQPVFDAMSGVMQTTRIPTQLEYTDVVAKDAAALTQADDATITPSTIVPSEFGTVDGQVVVTPAATQARKAISQSPELTSENFDTQTSNVPRIKSALQGFMLPEILTQGDTQTQRLMRPPPPPPPVQINRIAKPEKMLLLPQVAKRLESEHTKLHQAALKLAKPIESREKGADVVLCQCGYLEEEGGEMIGCSYCDTWQHYHCYGFTGPDDPRVPEEHACYQCLLAGRDDTVLSTLKALALKRRGMNFALRVGLWRKGNLAKEMDVDADVGRGIHEYLRTEGFVVDVYKSHKPGFAATGKPLFIPVTEGADHDKMIRDLFDPLLHIEYYYAAMPTPTSSELIGQQLYALRAADMPAPATPHQRRKGSATPASNLDLRPSMTPYETPLLSRFPPRKRPSDDEGVFDTPAKRRATETPLFQRLKSIQTTLILNADGMSSSPASNHR